MRKILTFLCCTLIACGASPDVEEESGDAGTCCVTLSSTYHAPVCPAGVEPPDSGDLPVCEAP